MKMLWFYLNKVSSYTYLDLSNLSYYTTLLLNIKNKRRRIKPDHLERERSFGYYTDLQEDIMPLLDEY